jgi:hypothetical protein
LAKLVLQPGNTETLARLRTHGIVAILAKATSLCCALRWAQIHHFHFVPLLKDLSKLYKFCMVIRNNYLAKLLWLRDPYSKVTLLYGPCQQLVEQNTALF